MRVYITVILSLCILHSIGSRIENFNDETIIPAWTVGFLIELATLVLSIIFIWKI